MANYKTKKLKDITNFEPLESAKAFELYYAMGEKRHVAGVGRKLKLDSSVVRLWQQKYFWEERILARDYQQIKTIRVNSNRDVTEMKMKFGEAIRNSITQLFLTDPKTEQLSFKIKPKNIYELESAVKLWLLLMGESTDIHSVKVEVVETVINHVIQVIQLHVKDPKLISEIALDLQKGKELIWAKRDTSGDVYQKVMER